MTSKFSRALLFALLSVGGVLHAAGDYAPAYVISYYDMHFKDEPTGVYELVDRDLLFVQIRQSLKDKDVRFEPSAHVGSLEYKQLLFWLTKEAAKKREDPVLKPGGEQRRKFVRRMEPMWEYSSRWNFSQVAQRVSRYEIGEYVSCAIYKRSEVLKSMPEAFLLPVGEDVWVDGAKIIVAERYALTSDRGFMWHLGALDGLELMLDEGQNLRAWVADFGSEEDERYTEFKKVQEARSEYLSSSEFAKYIAAEKVRRETLPDKIDFIKDEKPLVGREEIVRSAVTNQIDELEFEIVETEVKRETYAYHKIVTKMAVDPVFEKLFLSGGSMKNEKSPRTAVGKAAEKAFYAKSSKTSAEREQLIIAALQENPGDHVLWNLLGRTRMNAGDLQGAIIAFRNALRLDMRYEFAATNLAIAYDKLGYKQLAYSAAISALGISKDKWCLKEAEKILQE